MALCLRVLLAFVLSMSPLALASAAPMEASMTACGMMDDDADCCAVVCAVAGGCVTLPTPQTTLEQMIGRPGVKTPPTTSRGPDLVSGPEPPPPRVAVA